MGHILSYAELMCLQPGTILQADYFGVDLEVYECTDFQENQILDGFNDNWMFSTKIDTRQNIDEEELERMQPLDPDHRESPKIFKLPNKGFVTYSLKR